MSDEEASLLALIDRIEYRPPPPPPPAYSVVEEARSGDRLKNMIEDLKSWRFDYWRTHFPYVSFSPEALLSNRMIAVLARNASVKNMNDLAIALPGWGWLEDFGPLVLARMEEADATWKAKQDRETELKEHGKEAKVGSEARLGAEAETLAANDMHNS